MNKGLNLLHEWCFARPSSGVVAVKGKTVLSFVAVFCHYTVFVPPRTPAPLSLEKADFKKYHILGNLYKNHYTLCRYDRQ